MHGAARFLPSNFESGNNNPTEAAAYRNAETNIVQHLHDPRAIHSDQGGAPRLSSRGGNTGA